jgi:hypothetical protein
VFTFIEAPTFESLRAAYLDDDEFADLQVFMMENPEAGNVIPGTGGVRKLRWRRGGSGKRRRIARDLLRTAAQRALAADTVRQGQAGERARPHSPPTEGGA